jgi:predicted hotdog family 3-hydroxylacyl-ACP dehydratase
MTESLLANTWPVHDLLVHRDPMIFIDRVVEAGQAELLAEVRIGPGVPLYQEGIGVPAWVGLEYMAQSIAALSGLRARVKAIDGNMPLGLLIGCRKYASDVAVFPNGANLKIRVIELDVIDKSLGAFDCTIGNPDVIVTARVMVYGRSHGSDAMTSVMKRRSE